jgi:hypothetical protein
MQQNYNVSDHDFTISGQCLLVVNIHSNESETYDLSVGAYLLKITDDSLYISASDEIPPAYQHDFDMNSTTVSFDEAGKKIMIIGTIDIDTTSGGIIAKDIGYIFDINDINVELSISAYDQNVLSVRVDRPVMTVKFLDEHIT